MNKLDTLIKEALSQEEQGILENTQELGWFALGRSQFQGKLGWVTWVIMITQAVLFLIGSLKFSLMPKMQADRVLREIKRVELLIAHSKP